MDIKGKKNRRKLRAKPSRQIRPKMVKNPLSGRFIKVGGKTWSSLVRDGHIRTGNYQHPNTLLTIDEDDFSDEEAQIRHLELEKAKWNRDIGHEAGVRAVRKGRTRLIKQRRKLTNRSTAEKTAIAGSEVIARLERGEIDVPPNMTRKEKKQYLQDLIQDQLISRHKKKTRKSQFQVIDTPPNSEDEEDTDSDEYEYYSDEEQ